ncbi:hypothetical protein NECAME_14133, partial [Necator americanus]
LDIFQEETPAKPPTKKADGLTQPKKGVTVSNEADGKKIQDANQGLKRKAVDVPNEREAKHAKLDENVVVDEENKRRQERDERSLFIKGFPKNTKTQDLEALHADIETVRHRKGTSFAWLVFRNQASCKKAHSTLSITKIGGKPLFVDFCGSKSAKAGTIQKESKPINPLELYINGLPPMVTKEDIKNVFRAAVSIHIPNTRAHEMKRAFILFSSEDDAKSAFDKGKGLKLSGKSVEVFYARVRRTNEQNTAAKPAKGAQTVKPASSLTVKKAAVAPRKEESDSDEEEIESSDEGIEEVPEKHLKKSPLKAA